MNVKLLILPYENDSVNLCDMKILAATDFDVRIGSAWKAKSFIYWNVQKLMICDFGG